MKNLKILAAVLLLSPMALQASIAVPQGTKDLIDKRSEKKNWKKVTEDILTDEKEAEQSFSEIDFDDSLVPETKESFHNTPQESPKSKEKSPRQSPESVPHQGKLIPQIKKVEKDDSELLPAKTTTLPSKYQKLVDANLLEAFKREPKNKDDVKKLRDQTMLLGPKAVPTLMQVLRNEEMPDQNRWVGLFLLGKIMGKKSTGYISKFLNHPNWPLRLAALKGLLALNSQEHAKHFVIALNDPSLLVRSQAIENINKMGLKEYAPFLWKTLFNAQNYGHGKEGRKRTFIFAQAIRALGDLEYKGAGKALLKMAQTERYNDIYETLDYTLSKITGKSSPQGDIGKKKGFWKTQTI